MRSEKKETALPVPRTLKEYTLITAAPSSSWISASMFLNFQTTFPSAAYPEWQLSFAKFSSLLPPLQINLVINLLLLGGRIRVPWEKLRTEDRLRHRALFRTAERF